MAQLVYILDEDVKVHEEAILIYLVAVPGIEPGFPD